MQNLDKIEISYEEEERKKSEIIVIVNLRFEKGKILTNDQQFNNNFFFLSKWRRMEYSWIYLTEERCVRYKCSSKTEFFNVLCLSLQWIFGITPLLMHQYILNLREQTKLKREVESTS